jgi:hypothetical protein
MTGVLIRGGKSYRKTGMEDRMGCADGAETRVMLAQEHLGRDTRGRGLP